MRIYDKKKILSPKRTSGNQRLYSIDDIKKAYLIQFMTKNLGLNLVGVKLALLLLDGFSVDFNKQFDLIQKILDLHFGSEVQKENIEKNLKKGRKRKNS